MIVVLRDHFARHLLRLALEVAVAHLLETEPARMIFLPDKDARLIAQIEEHLVVGIVRSTHGICAEIAQNGKIVCHRGKGKRAAVLRVIFMTAQPSDPDRLPVEKDPAALRPHLAEAEAVDEIVKHRPAPLQRRGYKVQFGMFGGPLPRVGKGKRALQHRLAAGKYPFGEAKFPACDRHTDADGRSLLQIFHPHPYLRRPDAAAAHGRDAHVSDIAAPDALQHDGAGDAAI